MLLTSSACRNRVPDSGGTESPSRPPRRAVLGIFLCAALAHAGDYAILEQQSDPQGIIANQSDNLLTNTVQQTVNAVPSASGYGFAYWTLNGEPVRDIVGQSPPQATFLFTNDTTAVAWYLSPSLDTDTDGCVDYLEWRHYGSLTNGPAADVDGDGFNHAQELERGYNPAIRDTLVDGGLMLRISETCTLRDEAVKKRYEIRSEPQGIVAIQTGYATTNTVVTTPSVAYGATSGYYFGYWEVNGVRQAGPTGLAISQVALTMTNDVVAVARFFTSADADADGLADWREWYWFGNLDAGNASDPDGDGFTVAEELARGYEPHVRDVLVDGGLMLRLSETAVVDLTGMGIARADTNMTCYVEDTVTLDGSASLNVTQYLWRVVAAPAGSTAVVQNAGSVVATFTPDLVGTYEIELSVTGSRGGGPPDVMAVTAIDYPRATLTVSSVHGDPSPAVGVHAYRQGTLVSPWVQSSVNAGGTRHTCQGWVGTGSLPATGVAAGTGAVALMEDSLLTWLWSTDHWVNTAVDGQGNLNVTDHWALDGANLTVVATPAYGWLFTGWSGSLSGDASATQVVVTVSAPLAFTAHFSDDPDGDGVNNINEWALGTNPWARDSDADGFDDGFEVAHGWDPIVQDNAVSAYVAANPGAFGLMAPEQVEALTPGGVWIEVDDNMARLVLQMQVSRNLADWANAGPPVMWTYPVDDNGPRFFRVVTSPPSP